jgi:hypothetical protein
MGNYLGEIENVKINKDRRIDRAAGGIDNGLIYLRRTLDKPFLEDLSRKYFQRHSEWQLFLVT